MVETMRVAEGVGAGSAAGCRRTVVPPRDGVSGSFGGDGTAGYGEATEAAGAAGGGSPGGGPAEGAVEGQGEEVAPDGGAGGRPGWSPERFPGWVVWFGRVTGRWWALPPEWCWHAGGLVEAGSREDLADRMLEVERARPRFDRGRGGPPPGGAAGRRPRSYGGSARRAGQVADGRCRS